MEFSAIQTDVDDLVQELTSKTGVYTATKLKHYINRGYYDFARRTKCIESSVDITSVDSQVTYAAADAANLAYVYEPYEVRHIEESVTEPGDILKPLAGGSSGIGDTYEYGTPDRYYVRGVHSMGKFEIGTWPVLNVDDATIRVYAYMFPIDELDDDADEPLIKEAWCDALTHYAAYRLFKSAGHLREAWNRKADEEFRFYLELVNDFNTEAFNETEDDFPVVYDAY